MKMTSVCRRWRLVLSACLAMSWPGCGSPTAPPLPTPPPPAPCTQTSVFGPVGGSLPASTLDLETFTTSTTGRVDVFADWTFATSLMGVYVVQGSCTLSAFNARTCNFLIRSEPGGPVTGGPMAPKPRRASAANVAPGTYSLLIGNFGTEQESVSAQVFLSSSTCPPFAAAGGAVSVAGPGTDTLGHSSTNGLR